MKTYVQISIRTKSETTDWSFGERLLESLEGVGLVPEQVSHNADKFIEPFLGVEESKSVWASLASIRFNGSTRDFYQDFAWRRKSAIKCTGSVIHTARNMNGKLVPGGLSFRAGFSDSVDWMSLFKSWCDIFPPQLGMLHIFTAPELQLSEKNGSFQIGSFNSALKPEVPNIGWAMFYGDEFAKEVNSDEVEASGFPLESLNNGYLVSVTNNIQDVVSDFSLFSKRRAELKRLFRDGFFLTK